MRKVGLSAAIKTKDGKLFCSPGGGYSTDGTSARVSQAVLRIRRECNSLEKMVRDAVEKGVQDGSLSGPFEFHLIEHDGRLYPVDEKGGLAVQIVVSSLPAI